MGADLRNRGTWGTEPKGSPFENSTCRRDKIQNCGKQFVNRRMFKGKPTRRPPPKDAWEKTSGKKTETTAQNFKACLFRGEFQKDVKKKGSRGEQKSVVSVRGGVDSERILLNRLGRFKSKRERETKGVFKTNRLAVQRGKGSQDSPGSSKTKKQQRKTEGRK